MNVTHMLIFSMHLALVIQISDFFFKRINKHEIKVV